MKTTMTIVGDEYPTGIRVDKYPGLFSTGLTRSQLKLRTTQLFLNGKEVKPSRKVFPGDRIEIHYLEASLPELKPEPIPLSILYEDDNTLVLNKPQGMVVHPGSGNYSGTLVHGLLAYLSNLEANFQDSGLRPGIVHRLDKDTSGVIIIAKNVEAHEYLSLQFRNREVKKTYLAIVKGIMPKQEDLIDMAIKRDPLHRKKFTTTKSGGKRAVTSYQVLKALDGYSLVKLKPKTGRTHQLRVHLKHISHPIAGDPLYSRVDTHFPGAGLMLHASELTLRLPGAEEWRTFTAPLPQHFEECIKTLDRQS